MNGGPSLLRHAHQLIERGWTQHADARTADDGVVSPWDDRAASWSLLGALVAAVEDRAAALGEEAAIGDLARTCMRLADTLDTDSLEHWNDDPARTREDVLAALDRAGASTADQDGDQPPSSRS